MLLASLADFELPSWTPKAEWNDLVARGSSGTHPLLTGKSGREIPFNTYNGVIKKPIFYSELFVSYSRLQISKASASVLDPEGEADTNFYWYDSDSRVQSAIPKTAHQVLDERTPVEEEKSKRKRRDSGRSGYQCLSITEVPRVRI